MTEKCTDADSDDCNDDFDSNNGNFDHNNDKNDHKNYKNYDFLANKLLGGCDSFA